MTKLMISEQSLSYSDFLNYYNNHEITQVSLSETLDSVIQASAQCVATIVEEEQTVYGINTGFGLLASKKIPLEDLQDLASRSTLPITNNDLITQAYVAIKATGIYDKAIDCWDDTIAPYKTWMNF